MTNTTVGITLTASDETKAAFDSVNKGLGEIAIKSSGATAAFAAMSNSTRLAIQNASYQISDFAVQVNSGTSVSRALGQQLPQLLAGFGAFGAAAGVVASFAPEIIELFKSGNDVKSLGDSMKDLDTALSSVASATATFDMKPIYEEFNKSNAATRISIVSLLEYKSALADVSLQKAELSLSKELNELASFGSLDKLIGGDKAVDVARKFGIEIGVARDLLADARSGVNESSLLADRYATALAKGSDKGRELAAAFASVAKGSRDAAAAQTAISEAMAKLKMAGDSGIIPTGKKSKGDSETEKATAEAIAYGKSMDDLANLTRDADAAQLSLSKSQKVLLDLMSSAEWQTMPDAWKDISVAQFEHAYAAEQAADATKRLNEMLGRTESAGIEKAREDMLLLASALEAGSISEEKYIEAVNARLETGSKKIKEQKSLVEELGLTFTSSFEDAIVGAREFSSVLDGLAKDILRITVRKGITEPLGNFVGSFFGESKTGLASLTSSVNSTFAKGGVFENSPSLSSYSGKVYDSPQPFLFAKGAGIFGEAGPEAIMPLKRGRDGKLGVAADGGGAAVTVNVINNSGAQAKQSERPDGRGGKIIDILIEQVEAKIAGNISIGNGPVPTALQSSYGLNRTAGAY